MNYRNPSHRLFIYDELVAFEYKNDVISVDPASRRNFFRIGIADTYPAFEEKPEVLISAVFLPDKSSDKTSIFSLLEILHHNLENCESLKRVRILLLEGPAARKYFYSRYHSEIPGNIYSTRPFQVILIGKKMVDVSEKYPFSFTSAREIRQGLASYRPLFCNL